MDKGNSGLLEKDMLSRKSTNCFVNLALKNNRKAFMKEKKKEK